MFSKKKTPPPSRTRVAQPSSRGPVFSYHANRSVRAGTTARSVEEQQQPLKRGPRFPWLQHVPSIIAVLVGLLVLGMALQLGNEAKIVTVGPKESQVFLRDKQVYQDAARVAFSSFMNRNKLTVDTTGIAADFKKRFPELRVVSVSLPVFGNQPEVYVQPATPRLLLVSQSGTFVVDSDGRALMPANQVAGLDTLDIPVVNDQSGLPIEAGRIALPSATVAFITEVIGQHKAKDITISSVTLPAGASEMHLRLEGVGYFVKYNLQGNAREEAGAFIAVKAQLDREKKTPREYIDVRVENKAYYK